MLDQQQALIEALRLAGDALNAAPELTSTDKGELTEIVDSTVDEVQRARPNIRRLSQGLQDIAAAVQGIANGRRAYEAIRAEATASGIPI
jgi:hypothetical protein